MKRKVWTSNFNQAGRDAPLGKLALKSALFEAAVRTDSGNSKLKPEPAVAMPLGNETANIIDKPLALGVLRSSTLMPVAELPVVLVALVDESLDDTACVAALTTSG